MVHILAEITTHARPQLTLRNSSRVFTFRYGIVWFGMVCYYIHIRYMYWSSLQPPKGAVGGGLRPMGSQKTMLFFFQIVLAGLFFLLFFFFRFSVCVARLGWLGLRISVSFLTLAMDPSWKTLSLHMMRQWHGRHHHDGYGYALLRLLVGVFLVLVAMEARPSQFLAPLGLGSRIFGSAAGEFGGVFWTISILLTNELKYNRQTFFI